MRAILTVCVLMSICSQCDATGPSLLDTTGNPASVNADEQNPVIDQRPTVDNNPKMPSPFIQRHNVEISWPKIEIPITFTLQHEIQPDNYFIGCFIFIGVAIILAGYCQIVAANRNAVK